MPKSRIIQASAEFFNERIVNYTSTSLSTCFEADKFEHACSMKAIGHRSRKFVNNVGLYFRLKIKIWKS